MKHVEHPSTIIKYRGRICEVMSITNEKVLFIREIGAEPCPTCGEIKEYVEVECSPNFQERAEAINTLIE